MHMMQPVEAPAQTPHNPFDVCDCQDCLDEAEKLEYEEEDNQRKKKGSQFTLKQRYEAGDPTVGLLGEPSGKFDYYVLYGDSKPKPSPPPPLKHPPTPPKECFTLTPAPSPQNYHTEFPPLSTFENVQQKARHSWKIENPTTIGANGVQHQITPAEATLNWQSENAVAQNNALRSIIAKQEDLLKSQAALSNRMTGLEGIIYEIKNKILGIHNELLQMAYNNPGMVSTRSVAQTEKEAKMKFLKAQLADLERQHKQQRVSTLADDPWRLPSSPFVRAAFDPQPLQISSYPEDSPSLRLWSSEQAKIKARKQRSSPATSMTSDSSNQKPSTSKPQDPSTGKKVADESMMMASSKAIKKEGDNPISSFLHAMSKNNQHVPTMAPVITTQSDDESDPCSEGSTPKSYEDISPTEEFEHLFMTEPEHTERYDFHSEVNENDDNASNHAAHSGNQQQHPVTDSKIKFTFDDIPPSKWLDRSIEMLTWCEAELQYYDIAMVIKRFLARCQGRLRDWYLSLGEYRHLQLLQCQAPEAFIREIQLEFVGNPIEYKIRARDEFLKMKCCSFKQKDLEKHYNRMSERFYCLNGIDDVNLKQVFLNSFPESLTNEAYRMLENKNQTVANVSLGGLYQLIMNALTKLCNQQRFLAEFEKTGRRLGSACSDKHLKIGCKEESACVCPKGSKILKGLNTSRKTERRSNKNWKFLSKKPRRGRDTDRCYVCNKQGHFAKDCKDGRKTQALVEAINKIEPVDVSEIEFLYSLEDEPGENTICSIFYGSSSEDSSDEQSDSDTGLMTIYMADSIPRRKNSYRKNRPQRKSVPHTTRHQGSTDHVRDSLPTVILPTRENMSALKKKEPTSKKEDNADTKPTCKIRPNTATASPTLENPPTVEKRIPQKKAVGSYREKIRGHKPNTSQDHQPLERRKGPKATKINNRILMMENPSITVQDIQQSFSTKPDAYLKGTTNPKMDHQTTSPPSPNTMSTSIPSEKTPLHQEPKWKDIPEEVMEVIKTHNIKEGSLNYKSLLTIALEANGSVLTGSRFSPDYPFLNIFYIRNLKRLPKETLCFLWFLLETFTIAVAFNSAKLNAYLLESQTGLLSEEEKGTIKLLEWFLPTQKWVEAMGTSPKKHCLVLFNKPSLYATKYVYRAPHTFIQAWYEVNPSDVYFKTNRYTEWIQLRKKMATINFVDVESIPIKVLTEEEVYKEDDKQANEWEEAQISYYGKHPFFNKVHIISGPPQPPGNLFRPIPEIAKDWIKVDIWTPPKEFRDRLKAEGLLPNGKDPYEDDDPAKPPKASDSQADDSPDPYEDDDPADPYEDDPSHPDSRWK
ncbi:hypothetical protein QVD17_41461 [Tagetes erecta]|uniref:CCHC-type domain-containing protein n=1 Tax=Tagetes erecta TaxID=13708 RepID=A0AAD8NFM8_TARER|nr:hypothetical protein QVD17_41461 [Tagetes erecta]